MSWITKLYQTYEAIQASEAGKDLMPICHSKQNTHIEITLNAQGDFLRAKVLEKTQIVLPATEDSESRSSGEAPHGLADKLHYIAGDYQDVGGKKKHYFNGFIKQLQNWVAFNHHPKAAAVLAYLEKKSIIADLIAHHICFVDEQNQLLEKWQEGEAPALFKTLPKDKGLTEQGNALVCWVVEIPGNPCSKTWEDKSLQASWIDFIASQSKGEALCLVTGEVKNVAVKHPAKLRNSADSAKLISSNDGQGFTYRGRFTQPEQAATISFEVTQKAHNALRYLIQHHGTRNDDQYIVAWAINGADIPTPQDEAEFDFDDYLSDQHFSSDELEQNRSTSTEDHSKDLGKRFAGLFKKKLAGSHSAVTLEAADPVVVMTVDSATPGRMAILYYRDFQAIDYLANLEAWHLDFAWYQRASVEKQKEGKDRWYRCAPSSWAILNAVYGDILDSNKTLKKALNERLLPCIIERKNLPEDIKQRAFRRAIQRHSYKLDEQWQWEQNLGVTCGLYRGYRARKEGKRISMALEVTNNSRDYLYGRLLALADNIEQFALDKSGEKRLTNAGRLMQRFADRPFSTWKNIELALQPYMQRLQSAHGGFITSRKKEMDEVMSLFESTDFTDDKALSAEFLLAFHSQRLELMKAKEKESSQEQENIVTA